MKSPAAKFVSISVTFEKREDGGLRVYSVDVPEFVLSHSDCEAVFADIAPALETILSEKFHAAVEVGPLHSIREELEDNGVIPIYAYNAPRTYIASVAA